MNIENLNILDILQPELAILIPVCWGIGMIIKSSKIKNKFIPLILAIFSVAMATLYNFAVDGTSQILMDIFLSITQGIAYWVIAWIGYEKGIKTLLKKIKVPSVSTKQDECDCKKEKDE